MAQARFEVAMADACKVFLYVDLKRSLDLRLQLHVKLCLSIMLLLKYFLTC